ncbi:MAG: sulfatase-like hydrolase/transferase [Planctomycetes bacterium]|nr:sulfatase-like hydrolase/transferase [Planctomycetota bacterium]
MSAAASRPHILLIHTDQQRYRSLGCTGNPFAVTPHLDAFAQEACNFQRHIAANPVCMPSRASLFSGRLPHAHGVWTNGIPLPRRELTAHEPEKDEKCVSHVPLITDHLVAEGYRTASVGKLHLTPTRAPGSYGYPESSARWEDPKMADWHGPYCGFEHVDMSLGHGEGTAGHYGHWRERNFPEIAKAVRSGAHRKSAPFPQAGDLHPSVIPVEAHHSTWVAERTIAYLESSAQSERPFFLFAGFPDPHHPYTPPADLAAEFARREVLPAQSADDEAATKPEGFARLLRDAKEAAHAKHMPPACIRLMRQYYEAMVHLIDLSVGKIFAALRRLGLWEKTIVVFTSDHGDWLGDHGLRKKDCVCSEQLVHVPFLLRAPGVVLPPECSAPMSNVDVFPTLCELAGVSMPAGVQGHSVLPVLRGTSAAEPAAVVSYHGDPRYHNLSLYDERYRFTWYPALNARELYDHRADPHELRNLAGATGLADIEEQLYRALIEKVARTNEPCSGRLCPW